MRRLIYLLAAIAVALPAFANELDDAVEKIRTLDGILEVVEVPEDMCLKENIDEGTVISYDVDTEPLIDSVLEPLESLQFIDYRNDDVEADGWIVRADEDDITVLMNINVKDDNIRLVMLLKGPEKLLEGIHFGE